MEQMKKFLYGIGGKMNDVIYYVSFGIGLFLFLALVVLYFVLDIRDIARRRISKGKKIPRLLKNADKPIFKPKTDMELLDTVIMDEDEIVNNEILQETTILDEYESEDNK